MKDTTQSDLDSQTTFSKKSCYKGISDFCVVTGFIIVILPLVYMLMCLLWLIPILSSELQHSHLSIRTKNSSGVYVSACPTCSLFLVIDNSTIISNMNNVYCAQYKEYINYDISSEIVVAYTDSLLMNNEVLYGCAMSFVDNYIAMLFQKMMSLLPTFFFDDDMYFDTNVYFWLYFRGSMENVDGR